jgi:hypothetical protein
LQEFWPLQEFDAVAQALWPLHELPPTHFTVADWLELSWANSGWLANIKPTTVAIIAPDTLTLFIGPSIVRVGVVHLFHGDFRTAHESLYSR